MIHIHTYIVTYAYKYTYIRYNYAVAYLDFKGSIVLHCQTFIDACQNHASIKGSGYVRLAYKV